jgi:hypothetical protein
MEREMKDVFRLHRISAAVILAWVVSAGTMATSARADDPITYYNPSYSITLPSFELGGRNVTNIMLLQRGEDFSTTTAPLTATSGNTTVIDMSFFNYTTPVLEAVMLGLVQDLPNDAAGQKHVVIVMNSEAAAKVNNIAWGTLFTDTLESTVLSNIEIATGVGNYTQQERDAARQALIAFANGPMKNVPSLGPFNTPGSMWFEYVGFNTNINFNVVAFTEGKLIGEGFALQTVTVVPEPASALLLAGGALIAGLRSRTRKA